MPRMTGFELLAAVKADERMKYLPVILLSARAGDEAAVEGLQAGAGTLSFRFSLPLSARNECGVSLATSSLMFCVEW